MNSNALGLAWTYAHDFVRKTLSGKSVKYVPLQSSSLHVPRDYSLRPKNQTDQEVNRSLQAWFEFSRFVDLSPNSLDGDLTNADRISNVLSIILSTSIVADSDTLSDADKKRIKQAEGTLEKYSDVYYQYRDAYFLAEQALLAARLLTATELSAVELAAWKAGEGVKLRTAFTAATAAWIGLGKRLEWETAQQVLTSMFAASPRGAWASWSASLELAKKTDLDGAAFYPSFMNVDNIGSAGWSHVSVDSPSIPPAYGKVFGSNLRKVSFSYTIVGIRRSWLDAKFSPFSTRFWRSLQYPNVGEISSGVDDLLGRCPLISTAIVAFRDLKYSVISEPLTLDELASPFLKHLAVATNSPAVGTATTIPQFEAIELLNVHQLSPPALIAKQSHESAGNFNLQSMHASDLLKSLQKKEWKYRIADFFASSTPGATKKPMHTEALTSVDALPSGTAILAALICERVPICPNPDSSLAGL